MYLESRVTSRFRADSLTMPRDSSAISGKFLFNERLHEGGRGGLGGGKEFVEEQI